MSFQFLDAAALHVQQAGAVGVHGDRVDVLEFLGQVLLVELPGGLRGRLGAGRHERQLERLGAREASRGVAAQRPHDVDHAVARLVVERRRAAAELHGRIDLDLDASGRLLLDLLGPGGDEVGRHRRLRRQEVVDAQGDLLRGGRAGLAGEDGGGHCEGGTEDPEAEGRCHLLSSHCCPRAVSS
jgi:hypothetical protein